MEPAEGDEQAKAAQHKQQQHTHARTHARTHTPNIIKPQLHTSVECILPSTNKSQPTELFGMARHRSKNKAMQRET